jgi:hypothetical protein
VASEPTRNLTSHRLGAFFFVSANGRGDATDVEVVRFTDLLAELVEALDDGIAVFHGALPAGNSSGVQIIGGRKSDERQIASMLLRIAAFARCLQFHVNR